MFGGFVPHFRINWYAFVIAFAVGMLYVYISAPPHQVVVKYPTPFNAGKVTYVDSAGHCFQYKVEKLAACPKDTHKIRRQLVAA